VTALDQLSLAIEHAAQFGTEAASEWLADYDAGVGGLSFGPESAVPVEPGERVDADLLDREVNELGQRSHELAVRCEALQDHVTELETDARHRAALAIEWGDLQDAISAVPGMPADAVWDVLDAVRTAVTR
jgi:hypothetical protein